MRSGQQVPGTVVELAEELEAELLQAGSALREALHIEMV
jgi:hypothetical protein